MSLTRNYNDLSGIFGPQNNSGKNLFAGNNADSQDAAPQKGQSLEAMVAPKTKLQVTEANTPAVDPNKPNAEALSQQNAQKTAGAMQENLRTEASFEREVSQRAGEALDAEKQVDGTAFTPRMETPTGVEMVIAGKTGAASAVTQGLGSLITGGASKAGFQAAGKGAQVLDVLNDRKLSSEQARNEVGSILADSSGPAQEETNIGMISQANATDRVTVGADWQGIIAHHGDEAISEIVHYNPNDPSSAFSGMRKLKDAINQQEDELDTYDRQTLVKQSLTDDDSQIPVDDITDLDTVLASSLLNKNSTDTSSDFDREAELQRLAKLEISAGGVMGA